MSKVVSTAGRLRRLLAILVWINQDGYASIDETAERFDMSPDELVKELELAACCGVPPYSPDELLEIIVSDDGVAVRPNTALARPRRLSPGEGFALAASIRALLEVPGSDADGSLSSALAKLEGVMGSADLAVAIDEPEFLPMIKETIASNEALRITYYSAASDRESERTIVPRRLHLSEGHWRLDAWCMEKNDLRQFRVDRISAAEKVAQSGTEDLPGDLGPHEAYVPGPDSTTVRISAPKRLRWMLENVPLAGPMEDDGDRLVVTVHVGGVAWLERLLLRLGPDCEVLEPSECQGVASEAARRILQRYR